LQALRALCETPEASPVQELGIRLANLKLDISDRKAKRFFKAWPIEFVPRIAFEHT
jgi:hypothetical protein